MPHRSNTLPLARLAALLLACAAATSFAQTTEATQPAPAESTDEVKSERIERITHEDKLTRVDELRVSGQTRSIQVTPKNGAPAYEITPAPGGADLSESGGADTSTGKSRWRIFSF